MPIPDLCQSQSNHPISSPLSVSLSGKAPQILPLKSLNQPSPAGNSLARFARGGIPYISVHLERTGGDEMKRNRTKQNQEDETKWNQKKGDETRRNEPILTPPKAYFIYNSINA